MTYSRPWMYIGLALMAAGLVLLFQQGELESRGLGRASGQRRCREVRLLPEGTAAAPSSAKTGDPAAQQSKPDPYQWKSLFDGKSLDGWKTPDFGGQGKVTVKDGTIVIGMGSAMTGITWTGDVLCNNYEIELEGMRLDGSDFFCTTTFPVGNDPCTLVVGGWGGMVVGLSNVDFYDAADNATTKTHTFNDKQWYRVRIRVNDAAIQAWIDGERLVNQPREGHKFSIRSECDLCRPLGVSTWCTAGAVRNIRVRSLKPDEARAVKEEQ